MYYKMPCQEHCSFYTLNYRYGISSTDMAKAT